MPIGIPKFTRNMIDISFRAKQFNQIREFVADKDWRIQRKLFISQPYSFTEDKHLSIKDVFPYIQMEHKLLWLNKDPEVRTLRLLFNSFNTKELIGKTLAEQIANKFYPEKVWDYSSI
jgi:hypothetical protein